MPLRAAELAIGYVREGHGVVLRGLREYEAAVACLDAWYAARGRDGLGDEGRDTLYGMLPDGEECLFWPLVWYMAHWRAQHPEA